ncbi:hypothetical protein HYPSUDRAFT_209008 [Hypholoma sublateritium FD-334 SS-4]|uniref:Uncharacterized protein n=1 Tax=Hypholoma sublateritium (strain FD-334 SS-4) TaxID=945553 RepID=A0A0D2N4I4_HYPSF|nr:hypothetical protein HYPSUDRAFT_209008 [Hypholoma sublateritium FD-334 SS-4]
MADFFPSASPTAIGGFVTELLAPGQSIFGIRQGLRAFGDPRPEISFETAAEEFIKILYEANGAVITSQPFIAASQAVATPNPSAFVSTPQVVTASAAPQILTAPAASQVAMYTAPWQATTQTTATALAAQQMVAAVPQTTATAPGAPQSDIVPVVTAVATSQAAAPAASAAASNAVVTQSTTVPDDVDESSIESRSKARRSEAKTGVIHYIQSSPQNPFKAQTIYQVLKRNHILTYYQSISASKIAKPEIATDDLMPGDLYIHYNSTTGDSQMNTQGQLWVWPKLPTGWANKSGAYVGQNEIIHPVFENMSLFFAPSKSWEPNWYTKNYVKTQRVKEVGNQVMSASASSRSRG